MTLNELQIGQLARVLEFSDLEADIRKKLMVMGVLPNTQVRVLRKAPFGDPLQVEVRGVSVALRGKVAQKILVEAE